MNTESTSSRLNIISNSYPALASLLARYVDSAEMNSEGVICMGSSCGDSNPTQILLFPAIGTVDFDTIDYGAQLPQWYRDFLAVCNGVHFFNLYLLGYSVLLSRLKCRDLPSANRLWRDFDVPEQYLLLGGRTYSWDETVRYYFDTDNQSLMSVLANGRILIKWESLNTLMLEEIPIAEKLEKESAAKLAEVRRKALGRR